jgi:hypothetical protein
MRLAREVLARREDAIFLEDRSDVVGRSSGLVQRRLRGTGHRFVQEFKAGILWKQGQAVNDRL